MSNPIEAAFFFGENDNSWHARITWKCAICGRRNCKMEKGPGKLGDSLPLKVLCKFGHESEVVPYRYPEGFNKPDESLSITLQS